MGSEALGRSGVESELLLYPLARVILGHAYDFMLDRHTLSKGLRIIPM